MDLTLSPFTSADLRVRLFRSRYPGNVGNPKTAFLITSALVAQGRPRRSNAGARAHELANDERGALETSAGPTEKRIEPTKEEQDEPVRRPRDSNKGTHVRKVT